ncbi:Coa1/Tim21 domain-containing protein [Lignipirellula cremea]|uniref:Cytochrome oxidase complex assembly protein 1 n=1 Tax=Lignipirellula cremea TaxID=2528010 RepID=A0A518E355_9BACT|nr:cytochrome c oxidase assembly factor Coa1 family protein [Lignipirellula cremea]QDU98519.1 Cytochrome oxidase complex assembly protein 1 [Lignipirellula cremea]
MPAQNKANWWLWILVLIALPMFCVCGFCVWGIVGLASPNGAQQAAIPLIESNEELARELGSPVKASNRPNSNSIDIKNGFTSASATFNVSGPEGTGVASVSGHKKGEVWEVDSLKVDVPAHGNKEARTISIK